MTKHKDPIDANALEQMTELNIEQLKAAALAATDAREWSFMERGSEIVFRVKSGMQAIFKLGRMHDSLNAEVRANAAFAQAANPASVLELIADLERLRTMQGSAESIYQAHTSIVYTALQSQEVKS